MLELAEIIFLGVSALIVITQFRAAGLGASQRYGKPAGRTP